MAQYIDPSRITVVRDSNNSAQSTLDSEYKGIFTDETTYSKRSEKSKSVSIYIYIMIDKPIYLSSYEYDARYSSLTSGDTKTRLNLRAFKNYEDFTNNSNSLPINYKLDADKSNEKIGLYYRNVVKENIYRSQYFILELSTSAVQYDWVSIYVNKLSLFGEPYMPKYLLKDSNDNYYCKVNDDMIAYTKDTIVQDNLMDDVNTITKDNLELMNGSYKVLRVLVP